MSEVELERLVVRLVGEAGSYQTMMEGAAHKAEETAHAVEQHTHEIEGFGEGLKRFAEGAMEGFEALKVTEALKGAFEHFSEHEGTQMRLKALVEANGKAVGETMERYEGLTESIVHNTTTGEAEVVSILAKAEAMGKDADTTERMTRNALAFSAATGHGAEAGFRMAQALEMGNKHMLQWQLVGRGAKLSTEELDKMVKERLAAGFKLLGQETETASGKLKMLHNTWEMFKVEIGGIIATAVKPFVDAVRVLVDWFKQLSPEVKQAIVAVAGFAAAWLSVSAAMKFIAPLMAGMGPWVPIILLVAAAVTAIVESMGGWEAAWASLKEAAQSFMDWVQPIWEVIAEGAQEAWTVIVAGAKFLWGTLQTGFRMLGDYILYLWRYVSGDSTATWTNIRNFIRDSLLAVLFVFHNLGDVWDLVWTGIKLTAVKALNLILNNIFLILAGPFLLPIWAAMQINWGKLWDWMFDKAAKVLSSIGTLLAEAFADPAGFAMHVGELLKNAWSNISKNVQVDWHGVHIKALDDLQDQLQKEWDEKAKALGGKFEVFREEWLKAHPEQVKKVVEEAGKIGEAAGNAFKGKAKKETDKFDVALRFSAEAVHRVLASQERLQLGSEASKPDKDLAAVAAHGADAVSRIDKSNELLQDIRDTLKNNEPGVKINPGAGIA